MAKMASASAKPHRVLALYEFVSPKLEESSLQQLKEEIELSCLKNSVRGTLILSTEGLNGTVCYPLPVADEDEDEVVAMLKSKFPGARTRISQADRRIFPRLRIKIKEQIVTMGSIPVDPTETMGDLVKPGEDWDNLLKDPDCLVVDTRNQYEVRIGTFQGAVNPNTNNFTEFPEWLEMEAASAKKIAMFCTGGIRCYKATSLAKKLFPEKSVYHLDGGILSYLDNVKEEESAFNGECYVFDQRVAVTHGLRPSQQYISCFACRQPLSPRERRHPAYEEGLSCLYCIDNSTEKQKQRFEERKKQIELAEKEGRNHIHDRKYEDLKVQSH